MSERSIQDWITEHFEVGTIGGVSALACRRCGSFVWDTVKHMDELHPEVGDE